MTNTSKNYEKASIKKLEKSLIEISGSIHQDSWEKYRKQAITNINNSISIDGFRKGMVPESILLAKVGEMAVMEEMAELALSPAYMDIIIDNKIDVIGRPNIQITKLAKDNPLEFKIISAIMPEVDLPDYKKIASDIVKKQKIDDVKLTEEEFSSKLKDIIESAAPHTTPLQSSGGSEDKSNKNFAPSSINQDDQKDVAPLPELTDEFVKKLGAFSDVNDFKTKLRSMLEGQKRDEAIEKRRIQIADAIVSASKIDPPEILIRGEIERIENQFKDDIEHMGVKLDDYLKHAKKTIDEIRGEWRPHAEKKVKLQFVLNEISKKEKIKPSKEDIDKEVKHIVEHYKEADIEKANNYAETLLTNEMVFQFLEK